MMDKGIFIGYLIFLLIVGWLGSRRTKTGEDFYVAGRKLGSWVLAFTHEASIMSGWVFLGAAGFVYTHAVAGTWVVPGDVLGTLMVLILCGILVHRIGKLTGAISVIDVLEARYYDEDKRTIRLILTLVILFASWAYVVSQLVAGGKTLEFFFDWKYSYAVIVVGAIIIGYTMASGMLAVAWTDFVQGLLMLIGLSLAIIVALTEMGGFAPMLDKLHAMDPSYTKLAPNFLVTMLSFTVLLGSGTFGYLGQPHIHARYLAAKDEKTIANATVISVVVISIFMIGAALGGLAGKVLWPDPSVFPRGDPEYVLLHLFRYAFPPAIAALFTTAVLAGAMSTADSWLLVASTSASWDLYKKYLGKAIDQKKQVNIARITTLILGFLAILFSFKPESVFWLVALAWGTFASAIGPPLVLGLYWKRATRKGALVSIIVGAIVNAAWHYAGLEAYSHPAVPGMAAGFSNLR